TRIDAGIASLRDAQRSLPAWRSSVVRAAMTGRLVQPEAAVARATGRTFESASALLARLTSNAARWQAQGAYPLPEGWIWTELAQIARIKGGITKGQKRRA